MWYYKRTHGTASRPDLFIITDMSIEEGRDDKEVTTEIGFPEATHSDSDRTQRCLASLIDNYL
jgi:hypothetical protein